MSRHECSLGRLGGEGLQGLTDGTMRRTADTAQNWTAALRGLARAFAYPDAEWVASLLDGRWTAALTEVIEPLRIKAKRTRQAINALPQQPASALRALEVEYTRLFISAIPRVPAPPYASAYVAQGTLMGEPAEAAAEAYRRAGLKLGADCDVLPDHVAVELEFLAWLGEQSAAADEAGDETQRRMHLDEQHRFLHDHVQRWMPEFCLRVKRAARVDFYRESARIAERLVCAAREPAVGSWAEVS